jgi:hypothetical protein
MTHALRCLHPHVVAFQDIVTYEVPIAAWKKVEASTLHLQASANNFSSTQPFSNTVPSLWQLEWRHAVLLAMPSLAYLLVGNYSAPDESNPHLAPSNSITSSLLLTSRLRLKPQSDQLTFPAKMF